MSKDKPYTPFCWRCGHYMKLVAVTPKNRGKDEIDTYRCVRCGEVETVTCEAA